MPTVIALDVSISMLRPVHPTDSNDEYQLWNLAIHGINTLLDHMSIHCKLEFTALVVFSYLWENLVAFTRDFDAIKAALNQLTFYNKTAFSNVLTGIAGLVTSEWGMSTPSQVIIVTDGRTGVGKDSLLHSFSDDGSSTSLPLPYNFPCRIHVICIANPNDPHVAQSLSLYQKMIDLNRHGGEVFVPDGGLSLKSVEQLFLRLGQTYLNAFRGVLKCGNLKCNIQLHPPPEPYYRDEDEEPKTVSNVFNVCGFMDISDAASPAAISRHLILPIMPRDKTRLDESVKEDLTVAGTEEGKAASFTVLLHGSLKVEGMIAVTKVSEDWYGMMFSWADSKKKSNLMLALFEPGQTPVSWLGNLTHLGPVSDISEDPYGTDDDKSPFPVRPPEKRSYAQSCVVWIKAQGLQGDLQKVLRHARKLPEKQQQFYKEVNRIRRAALSFGFLGLLDALAAMLERECTILPGNTHPDAAIQLSHCANVLRTSEMQRDVGQIIMPLVTNFEDAS